jgi:hypothetical protein
VAYVPFAAVAWHFAFALTRTRCPPPPELARRAAEPGPAAGASSGAVESFKTKLLAARAENAALRKGTRTLASRRMLLCVPRLPAQRFSVSLARLGMLHVLHLRC